MREIPATAAVRSSSLLEMMRFQRVSPADCLPLTNGGGKKPPILRACKEGDADRIPNCSFPSSFDAKPLRARPPASGSASTAPAFLHFSANHADLQPPAAAASPVHVTSNGACSASGAGGNILPQWGHRKRSRVSRTESRAAAAADESSSSPSRQVTKIPRRAAVAEKLAAAMPPPCAAYPRGAYLRPVTPVRDATSALISRSVEERSGGPPRSEKRSPTSPAEKGHKAVVELPNGREAKPCPENETATAAGSGRGVPEKLNLRHFEWPRIYVSLSRKEKEDDFLAMKGTKLSQRPKKRAKNVDRILQYCYPGMWLSDLTRGRYEVREKKCVKKKRRGLKGMESMDSDSD